MSFLLLLVFGCESTESVPFGETTPNAVIGGENEEGYPAVGALVKKEWLSEAIKCTATLIKENWLLTAAHCLKDGFSGMHFAIGPQAQSGQKFSLSEAFVHPRYYPNPIGSLYDIALIRLSKAVPSGVATPIPYRVTTIEPLLGKNLLYIGYGSTSGTSGFLGLGVKRSVGLAMSRIDLLTYSNDFDGNGLCFGDSGGPGILETGGKFQVIGVTSASLGCQGGTCDSCSNGSKHTRLDRFADWIASIVGDNFVPCAEDMDRCVCDGACVESGLCDNALCGTDTCGDITNCIFDVCADSRDGACATGCIDDGHIAARNQLLTLVDCWAMECPAVVGSDNELLCLMENCNEEWNACNAQINPEPVKETDSDTETNSELDPGRTSVLATDTENDDKTGNPSEYREEEQAEAAGCTFQPAGASAAQYFFVRMLAELF